MKFKPLIGAEMSGKMGGIVASHNTYGSFFRRLVTPVNPKTAGQEAQRSAFRAVSTAWQAVITANKELWAAFAAANPVLTKKGDTVALTPSAMFIKLNLLRERLGLARVVVPPSGTPFVTAVAPTLFWDPLQPQKIWLQDNGADQSWGRVGGGAMLQICGPIGAGRTYAQTFKLAGTKLGDDTTPLYLSGTIPWTANATDKVRARLSLTDQDGKIAVVEMGPVVLGDLILPAQAIESVTTDPTDPKHAIFGLRIGTENGVADWEPPNFLINAVAATALAGDVGTRQIVATYLADVVAGQTFDVTAGNGVLPVIYPQPSSGTVVAG